MLDLAILGLLQGEELHGYEIRRQLRERLGLWANVSFGSLYPALARLERNGAVVATTAPGPTSPPAAAPPLTGSLSGEWAVLRAKRREHGHRRRSRKVYRITDTGHRLFAELLAGDNGTEDARSFALRWTFARYLTPLGRRALLERRRMQLAERYRQVTAVASDPRLDRYARAAVEHTCELLADDIEWIESLLASEEASTTPSIPQRKEHT